MSSVIDKPEQLYLFKLKVIQRSLELEVKTGLKHSRGCPSNAARQIIFSHGQNPARAKKALITQLKKLIEAKEIAMGRAQEVSNETH